MVGSTSGFFHLLCFHAALAATVSTDDSRPQHVRLQIDAHGSAVPRALMRQEDQSILEVDSTPDTLWGRFFGTGSVSVPDVLAIPVESADSTEREDASKGTAAVSAASASAGNHGTQVSSNASKASNGSNLTAVSNVTGKGASSIPSITSAKGDSKAISTNTFSAIAEKIKQLASMEDCKDTWEPEWSSADPEENCQLWAGNGEWGALATSASIKEACQDPWAQTHCTATCGCEVVKAARLSQAIVMIAIGLGLSPQQIEEVTSTLQTITSASKEAVLHVMGSAAVALNKTAAVNAISAPTTTAPPVPGQASETTTTTPHAAASDIIAILHALGFDAQQAKLLNATLQLIPSHHYSDILEVLKAIERAQPPSTTAPSTTAPSAEKIIETGWNIGLKTEHLDKINSMLKDIKPEWHSDILAKINESEDLVKQIGEDRTGRAILRHLQNLSRPSVDKLPEKEETNVFTVPIASAESRMLYRERQGQDARGFYVKVVLPVERLIAFIHDRAQVDVDPRTLSLAISRLEFDWPSSSCSNEESGFTDFKLLDFHSGKMVNEGSNCGSLVASSLDRQGELRLPSQGDLELFWLAGMFGSKYDHSDGGTEVNLKISELVFHEFRESGDVIEYSICGHGSLTWKERHFYLGCPKENPLEIVYSDESLGASLKLCGGGVPSEDETVQANCFEV